MAKIAPGTWVEIEAGRPETRRARPQRARRHPPDPVFDAASPVSWRLKPKSAPKSKFAPSSGASCAAS